MAVYVCGSLTGSFLTLGFDIESDIEYFEVPNLFRAPSPPLTPKKLKSKVNIENLSTYALIPTPE